MPLQLKPLKWTIYNLKYYIKYTYFLMFKEHNQDAFVIQYIIFGRKYKTLEDTQWLKMNT